MTEAEYYRLWNKCVQALHKATAGSAAPPHTIAVAIAECRRLYVQAIEIHNVNTAAIAAIVLADLIHLCPLEGWGVVDLETLDKDLARIARTRLIRNQSTVTAEEAAEILKCTPQHVRRLARAGRIAGRRAPHGNWRCSTASVFAYRSR